MLEEVISYIGTIHIAPNSSDDTVEKEDKETHDDKKEMDAIEEDMETWKKTLNKKSLNELGVEVESWCSNLTYAVDNQDTKMSEEVIIWTPFLFYVVSSNKREDIIINHFLSVFLGLKVTLKDSKMDCEFVASLNSYR